MEWVRVARTDQERTFSEADRWTLGNLLSCSADFCTGLAGFHNNMFLTVKESGRFLKNAVAPEKGGTQLGVHMRTRMLLAGTDVDRFEESLEQDRHTLWNLSLFNILYFFLSRMNYNVRSFLG